MPYSLVLPCYNPPLGWEKNAISKVKELQKIIEDELELIIVSDGYNYEKFEASILRIKQEVPFVKSIYYSENKGKGHALRTGIAQTTNPIIIYTDIDFPYNIKSIKEVYLNLKNKTAPIVIGVKDEEYYNHVPLIRKLISKNLKRIINLFINVPISDTQCGLKGFVESVKPVFLQTTINRYLFDLEFVKLVHQKKIKLLPLPLTLNNEVQFRTMNWKILGSELYSFIKITRCAFVKKV